MHRNGQSETSKGNQTDLQGQFRYNHKDNMSTIDDEALEYHRQFPAGKLSIVPTKPAKTQKDLSLAYTPGVAAPCLVINKDPLQAYTYTNKGNLVAVISNGTAVLGLGNIGAIAGKPVMEGKGLLFKVLAGVDAMDIEVDATDIDEFCQTVKNIAPTFGGINLEDIKAPECFMIEEKLKEELDIPVMHDDQHGTAIITGAAMLNALEIGGKKAEDIHLVVSGAGAAAIACTRLYLTLGVRKENVVMCDSKGVVRQDRTDINQFKREFATDKPLYTIADAMKGADVFFGFSKGNIITKEMVKTMGDHPIIMALANPDPEISYEDAREARPDALIATGRSDYPNQVNNVIGFPYIFRGALDTHSRKINEQMKIAAVHAIADLAKEPVPASVLKAYNQEDLHFGLDYILPKPLDPRLLQRVSVAVAKAAVASGVARRIITDWDAYEAGLSRWTNR
jgi:malate dehydrogenase (oxaloacetate-decarboxylating)(NADP+)